MPASISKSPDNDSDEALGFQKQPMVDWFSPSQLAQTGMRAIISAIFGSYADKREMQAALTTTDNQECFTDFSNRNNIWVDYVSDLGSGWNSTYSVAYLLGRKKLRLIDSRGTGHDLLRGNILIMGGDEVYPTATWREYSNRLVAPYQCSLPCVADKDHPPSLFSIPGNHDWYDGLSSFIKLFCQKRWIGGWMTRQTRSYFALKLPHNWWLWGLDIQLNADIDKPQLDYFDTVFKNMRDKDKIILCTAEPVWVYQQYQRDDKPYKNLDFFLKRYATREDKNVSFKLIMAGDLHHYTSFKTDDQEHSNWKITAGGGGAFTHPTHQIPEKLIMGRESYTQSAAYPDKSTSKKLIWNNLKFPFINRRFGVFFAAVYLLSAWLIGTGQTMTAPDNAFLMDLASYSLKMPAEVAHRYGEFLILNPASCILLILIFSGILAFADKNRKKTVRCWLLGGIHGFLQIILLLFAVWTTSKLILGVWSVDFFSLMALGLFTVLMAVEGWLLSGFLMGLYLIAASLLLKTHDTEAFSSFRGANYKNFVRLKVNNDGLHIYPVKIPKTCSKWKYNPGVEGEKPWYEPHSDLDYGLIEDPILIKNT